MDLEWLVDVLCMDQSAIPPSSPHFSVRDLSELRFHLNISQPARGVECIMCNSCLLVLFLIIDILKRYNIEEVGRSVILVIQIIG